MWILVARHDNEDNGNGMTGLNLFDQEGNLVRHYDAIQPVFEVLWFDDAGDKCYQIGIRKRTEKEQLEYDHDSIFEETAFFPGRYYIDNKIIDLIDPGTFDILQDGRLNIVQNTRDYHCEEFWVRIPPEHIDLGLFVQSIIRNI